MTMKLRQLSSDDLEELVKLITGCTCSAESEDGIERQSLTLVSIDEYRDIVLKNMDTSVEYVEKLNKTVEDDYADPLRDFSEKLYEQKSLEKLKPIDESKRTIGFLKDINEALKKYLEKIKESGTPSPTGTDAAAPGDFTAGAPPPLISRTGTAAGAAVAGAGKVIPTAKVAGAIAVVGSTAFIGDKAYAVTSERGMRNGKMHQGMDIAVPKGTELRAHEEGEIIYAGNSKRGYGNRVEIKTKDGRILAYSHLKEDGIKVKLGQKIAAGEVVGLSGNTGTSRSSKGGDGSHLHMEVKDKAGNFMNPREYLTNFANSPTKQTESTVKVQSTPSQINAIAETIKTKESQGNYSIENKALPGQKPSSASGAYQFTDSTWQSLTDQYGDNEAQKYTRAKDAPPEVQDRIAQTRIKEILKKNKGDVSKVPTVWFTGNPEGNNKNVTPQQLTNYIQDWNKVYGQKSKTIIQPMIVNTSAPAPAPARTVSPMMNQAGQKPKEKPGTNKGPGFPSYYS